ncbi:hypothetical protein BT63DRAFT_460300 [Microthyrium microscopicum]|uniref:Uncharacterized protein n=1 Tax=Microthyrium microscopicum TaxID=703497 RepID=A0A6A6U0N5_9PEZI|nr:hypothetical protein BT63DRAFT_460300 [Microthyrium microscopicum]
MAAFVPPPSGVSYLQNILPFEIREMIFEHLLVAQKPIGIGYNTPLWHYDSDEEKDAALYLSKQKQLNAAILSTCSQFHHEFQSMIWNKNVFDVRPALRFPPKKRTLKMGEGDLGMWIPSTSANSEQIKRLQVTNDSNWPTIVSWDHGLSGPAQMRGASAIRHSFPNLTSVKFMLKDSALSVSNIGLFLAALSNLAQPRQIEQLECVFYLGPAEKPDRDGSVLGHMAMKEYVPWVKPTREELAATGGEDDIMSALQEWLWTFSNGLYLGDIEGAEALLLQRLRDQSAGMRRVPSNFDFHRDFFQNKILREMGKETYTKNHDLEIWNWAFKTIISATDIPLPEIHMTYNKGKKREGVLCEILGAYGNMSRLEEL